MTAMMIKEFRELVRDRTTLAMLIALPVLFLVIFGYAANFTVETQTVAIYGPQADAVRTALSTNPEATKHFEFGTVDAAGDASDAKQALVDQEANIALVTSSQDPGTIDAKIDGSGLLAAQSALVLLNNVTAAGPEAGAPTIKTDILFNPDLKTSWVMIPALIGLILTFIGTVITSLGIVREREAGTLEQLAVMPLRAGSVVFGKIAPYFIIAAIDMFAITVLGMLLFDVPFRGSVLIYTLGAALFLFVVLGIGVMISTVAKTSAQAIQLAIMTLLPQVLLSGMIFPLEAMAAGVRWIGYLLPLTYFTKISQGVMLRDASWGALALPFGVLTLLAVVFSGLAVARLRATLAPAGSGRGGHS